MLGFRGTQMGIGTYQEIGGPADHDTSGRHSGRHKARPAELAGVNPRAPAARGGRPWKIRSDLSGIPYAFVWAASREPVGSENASA